VENEYGNCDNAYAENGTNWSELPALPAIDTADGVRTSVTLIDATHAKFKFLEDVSSELAIDPYFTITNNSRWHDDAGFTFGSNTYHYFQFHGGDYLITTDSLAPYGKCIVDMSSY
jgi:hypothetical protein